MFAVLDFETYWDSRSYTLSKMGPLEYVRDPRFKAQMVAVCEDFGTTTVHADEAGIRQALERLGDAVVIGHNLAGFDALILSERYGVRPRHLLDTIGMMNWTGISRLVRKSHAALTQYLGTGEKKSGTVVSDGKQWPDDFTPDERVFFMTYCRDDAAQCAANAGRMLPYMTNDALRFLSITARMATEPVFELDERMLVDYIVQLDEAVAKARQDIMSVFRFPDEASFLKAVRSASQFCVMLRHLGVEPPMKESAAKTATLRAKLEAELAQARTDEEVLAVRARMDQSLPVMTPALSKQDIDFLALREHEDPRVRLLVEARLEHNSSISRSRAERFLAFARHHRPVPVMLSAFNAHTSRYTAGAADEGTSSDRLQFQNLSKRDPSKAVLRKAIHAPAGHKVVACDSSQVEARCLAWVAGQNDLVEQFRHGRDPYSELAADIFGVSADEIKVGAKAGDKKLKTYRNVGKTCILSCLAGNVEVLTDTGWKRMDTVSINDKVWDGISWVTHEGLICNGVRNTISVGGISMTPDHLIFDGSSWRTGAALLAEPRYLKSARRWASDAYRIAQSKSGTTSELSGIKPLAPIAERLVGTKDTRCLLARWRNFVHIANREMRHSLSGVGNAVVQPLTRKLALCSASSQCLPMSVGSQQVDAGTIARSCGAVAVPNLTGFCKQIFATDAPHDVTLAPRRKPGEHKIRNIGVTQTSCLMWNYVTVCSSALPLASRDAVRHKTSAETGNTTGAEGYVSSSRTAGRSSRTLSRFRDTITHCLNWTASIATATTRRAISALSLGKRTCATNGMSATCRNASTLSNIASRFFFGASEPCSTNWQKVYDLKNCGPNNRFLIRKGTTVLMAHNCGYGVGSRKFADTLLRQGAKLDNNIDKHNELAFHAHNIYRMKNYAIVAFWKTCGNVLDMLAHGMSGSFGGPDNGLFKYGLYTVCGVEDVPSIVLPSGFAIRYPNLRFAEVDGKGTYVYDRPKGHAVQTVRAYGPAITENCIQSLAFQILMWQACRMDEAGISIKCNIHDSFATVVPEAEAEQTAKLMEQYMSMCPPWADTLPLACESEIGDDFSIV